MPRVPESLEELKEQAGIQGRIQAMAAGEQMFKAPPQHQRHRQLDDTGPVASMSFQTGPIDFSGGTPVNGWANLTIYQNGNYEFQGHFHDSGTPSYDAGIAWVLVASDGQAFLFGRKVHLNGTFEAGSRDGNWDDTGNNPDVAAHWAALQAGWHWRWSAAANWDWGILVKQVEDGLKAAGTIIGGIVAVVALF